MDAILLWFVRGMADFRRIPPLMAGQRGLPETGTALPEWINMRLLTFGFAALALAAVAPPADSQAIRATYEPTYADLADLALTAPIAAHVEVRRVKSVREEDAAGLLPGHRRFLIEADVVGLIRGANGLRQRVRYLVDLPEDPRGRAAKPARRSQFLVFAEPVPGEPDELRLASPDAQIPFSPETAERLRRILREAVRPDSPPRVVGIGRAFHVPGVLPGESETQIFLLTADERPISLNVVRRPGERPRWSVALSEIVEQASAAPEPETLLWYRLACFLPRALPAQSVRDAAPGEAQAIQADYRLVLERLGPCIRNRIPADF